MLIFLLYLLSSAASAFSSVSVVNPLDNQLPFIARANSPFSWSFSPDTFESSTSDTISYTTTALPGWLTFDPLSRLFSGTPTSRDEGNPEITVTGHDSSSSAPSRFTLCVTAFPAPTLNLPVATQFYRSNPSLSSVFLLSPNSALATDNPALRVPPKWSFSIGFEGDTFKAANDLYYDALLVDGSALPTWLEFDKNTITFDGVSPSVPQTVTLALHASDQVGYTSSALPFNLIVAAHELSQANSSLPTINVTASTAFNVSLFSPNDFSGVLVDGSAITPSEISSLTIDTSQYGNWLKYDEGSRTLSGQPPGDLHTQGPVLPVTLTSTFNQSIQTNVSLAIVPPYFTESTLPSVLSNPGDVLHFGLGEYFSNATQEDVNLTAAFDPTEAGNYLSFDPNSAHLSGTIPSDLSATGADSNSNSPHISITFTAYSYVTHSTSHTSLEIVFSGSNHNEKGRSGVGSLSPAARAKLVLGLGIAFGIIGGLVLVGGLLAAFRRCAQVEDTALIGEEGRRGWTAGDRKWYGIAKGQGIEGGAGYGWSEGRGGSESPEKVRVPRMVHGSQMGPESTALGQGKVGVYRALGLGLSRVSNRAESGPSQVSSRGYMSKAEFMGKIRETVRNVSDRYRRGARRPVIGPPLLTTRDGRAANGHVEGLPFDGLPESAFKVTPNMRPGSASFDDASTRKYADSALTASPSNSTGERSIPRRRADFAPPKLPHGPREPAPVHLREQSAGSADSIVSDSSVITHGAQAVVKTATRATSVRSAKSISSGMSHHSETGGDKPPGGGRPRLVAFTSASRVPVPSVSSTHLSDGHESAGGDQGSRAKRVTSQTARVFKNGSLRSMKKMGSVDELAIGMHYVRSLGGDERPGSARNSTSLQKSPSTPTVSTNVRTISGSSFSSLESSHIGHGAKTGTPSRVLVRANEKFKFKVPVLQNDKERAGNFEARLVLGGQLPKFLHIKPQGLGKPKGVVEFFGVPSTRDLGEIDVGVYESGGDKCLGRVIVEVVGRSQ